MMPAFLPDRFFLRLVVALVLLVVMAPALTGYHFRIHFIDHFQEVISKKALLTDEDAGAATDFKKPRYSVLDYHTLLGTMFVIVSIVTAVTHPAVLVRKPPDGYRQDIFIPPELC